MEDRIQKLGNYFRGIDRYNEALVVRVIFPKGWATFPSEEGGIRVAASEDTPGEWFYYGNSNECSLNDIFDLIDATIQSNQDMLMKIELLKEKITELKEEFSKRDYKELVGMSFNFPKQKGRKKNTKKKVEYKIEEAPLPNAPVEPVDTTGLDNIEVNKEVINEGPITSSPNFEDDNLINVKMGDEQ